MMSSGVCFCINYIAKKAWLNIIFNHNFQARGVLINAGQANAATVSWHTEASSW
jgi:hypothetical protein